MDDAKCRDHVNQSPCSFSVRISIAGATICADVSARPKLRPGRIPDDGGPRQPPPCPGGRRRPALPVPACGGPARRPSGRPSGCAWRPPSQRPGPSTPASGGGCWAGRRPAPGACRPPSGSSPPGFPAPAPAGVVVAPALCRIRRAPPSQGRRQGQIPKPGPSGPRPLSASTRCSRPAWASATSASWPPSPSRSKGPTKPTRTARWNTGGETPRSCWPPEPAVRPESRTDPPLAETWPRSGVLADSTPSHSRAPDCRTEAGWAGLGHRRSRQSTPQPPPRVVE